MKVLIGVSDFGKIRKAEIDAGSSTVLIGSNNSGKSSLLQLIYGLLQRLPKLEILMDDYEIDENTELEITRETEWFLNYERRVNTYLMEHKEKIVESIFRKSIPVGSIYIKILDINEKIMIQFNAQKAPETKEKPDEQDNEVQDICTKRNSRIQLHIQEQDKNSGEVLYSSNVSFKVSQSREFIKLYVEREVTGLIWNLCMGKKEQVFLPASKMGLQLLYPNFITLKESKKPSIRMKAKETEQKMSLPVSDFLQFLADYTSSNKMARENKTLLDFIEKYLINGKLQQEKGETVYLPEREETGVPLGFAPPAVNELAPLVKALTGTVNYQYIFCDSIESCLDATRQQRIARLLVKLNNAGKRMIVSTTSESILTELGRLVQVSSEVSRHNTEKERLNALNKQNLAEDDMLLPENIHVYQFFKQSDGTSIVDEVSF